MGRTLRSKKLRSLLYYAQDGKCAICGCELPDDWHADHIVPHVVTKRTNPFEMQALCPRCNLEKGRKPVFQFEWNKARRGAQEAVITAVSRFTGGHSTLSIKAPTRYGKTAMGRLITGVSTQGWMTPDGQYVKPFASTNVWVTVNVTLREQATIKKKWDKSFHELGVTTPLLYAELNDTKSAKQISPNGEHFVSVNVHKFLNDMDIWHRWIDSKINQHGLPPIFHFDEIHLYNTQKSYGEIVQGVLDRGAFIVAYTATPVRADGGRIPGFETFVIGSQDAKRSVVRDSFTDLDGTEYLIIDNEEIRVTDFLQTAHVEIPWAEAWQEGYLSKVSFRTIDVDMTEIDLRFNEDLRSRKLSDLTEQECKRSGIITKCAESIKVIRQGVEMAYEAMLEYRRFCGDIGIVVFSNSDRDGGKNDHANAIKREFLRLNPNLKVDIATRGIDDASDIISAFEENTNEVIIFKQMGGVGWDCSRVNIVLDLSNDRQEGTKIQAWMRGGTPHKNANVFTIITLADKLAQKIWEDCIDKEGGTATAVETQILTVQQTIKKKEDKDKKNPTKAYIIDESSRGNFTTHENNMASGEDDPIARAIFSAFPEFLTALPDADAVSRVKAAGLRPDPATANTKTIDEQRDTMQASIVSTMHMATKVLIAKTDKPYDPSTFGEYSKIAYRILYERASMPKGSDFVRVKQIHDLEQLRKLDRVSQVLVAEWRQ